MRREERGFVGFVSSDTGVGQDFEGLHCTKKGLHCTKKNAMSTVDIIVKVRDLSFTLSLSHISPA